MRNDCIHRDYRRLSVYLKGFAKSPVTVPTTGTRWRVLIHCLTMTREASGSNKPSPTFSGFSGR